MIGSRYHREMLPVRALWLFTIIAIHNKGDLIRMKKLVWITSLMILWMSTVCFADDFSYIFHPNDNTADLLSYDGTDTDVVIPAACDGYKVERIGTMALSSPYDLENLIQSVEIEEGIEVIGASAFWRMTKIREMVLPASVKEIEECAFMDCSSLTEVVLPEGLTEIGNYAFSGCISLQEITIPDTVAVIGKGAFEKCKGLKTIHAGDTDIRIKEGAFAETPWLRAKQRENYATLGNTLIFCKRSSRIVIPEGITGVADNAFDECSGSLEIGPDITWIGSNNIDKFRVVSGGENVTRIYNDSGAFFSKLDNHTAPLIIGHVFLRYSGNDEVITIPEGITGIAAYAFYDCENLKEIVLPESLRYLGSYAFSYCENLSSLHIPQNVEEIGDNPIDDAGCMVDFSVTSDSERYVVKDALLYDNQTQTVIASWSHDSSVTIPKGTKVLGYDAMAGCTHLVEINLPDTLRTIDSFALGYKRELKSVLIPDQVNRLGKGVFSSCPSLEKVIFGRGIVDMGIDTFSDTRNLVSVVAGENIKYMELSLLASGVIPQTGYNHLNKNVTLSVVEGSYAQRFADEYIVKYETSTLQGKEDNETGVLEADKNGYRKWRNDFSADVALEAAGIRFWFPDYVEGEESEDRTWQYVYFEKGEDAFAFMAFHVLDLQCSEEEFINEYDSGIRIMDKHKHKFADSEEYYASYSRVFMVGGHEVWGCEGGYYGRLNGISTDEQVRVLFNESTGQAVLIWACASNNTQYQYKNLFQAVIDSAELAGEWWNW